MFAGFDDVAALDHDQAVGAAQGAEAVGDGDGGAAADQVFQGRLNFALGFGIDRGGGFVEDQDARVDQQRAGDRDALAFAAGEGLAALADEGIVAVGQLQDEFVGVGGAGGVDNLLPRGVGAAVGDVLGDGAVEQERSCSTMPMFLRYS